MQQGATVEHEGSGPTTGARAPLGETDAASASAGPWPALVSAASIAVLLGVVHLAQAVLIPLAFAAVGAAVLMPAVRWVSGRGVPWAVAVVGVTGAAGAAGLLVVQLVATSGQAFVADLPRYREALEGTAQSLSAWFSSQGVVLSEVFDTGQADAGALLSSLGGLLGSLATLAGDALMVTLFVVFMLLEADSLARKARGALAGEVAERLLGTGASLQTYLVVKTVTSALTGAGVWLGLVAVGLDHALLWAFLAFLLNYIPTIGSIVAAIPAVVLALVTGGLVDGGVVIALYVTVNMVIGNVLEPRILGDSLGLSPLVVLIALSFWGFMWGTSGMLLSVPIMVCVREVCGAMPATRWVAVLLGPGDAAAGEPLATG